MIIEKGDKIKIKSSGEIGEVINIFDTESGSFFVVLLENGNKKEVTFKEIEKIDL